MSIPKLISLRRGADPQFWSAVVPAMVPYAECEGPCWLVVDPGLGQDGGCGWSLWVLDGDRLDEPLYAGVIYRTMESWVEQATLNTTILRGIKQQVNLTGVAVEYPNFFGGPRGMACAKSGSLVKLAYQTGQIAGLHLFPRLVTVSEWKGNKQKAETRADVLYQLGEKKVKSLLGKNYNHNALDSLGIGLYLKRVGCWKKE